MVGNRFNIWICLPGILLEEAQALDLQVHPYQAQEKDGSDQIFQPFRRGNVNRSSGFDGCSVTLQGNIHFRGNKFEYLNLVLVVGLEDDAGELPVGAQFKIPRTKTSQPGFLKGAVEREDITRFKQQQPQDVFFQPLCLRFCGDIQRLDPGKPAFGLPLAASSAARAG
jgi:hypothetical protein